MKNRKGNRLKGYDYSNDNLYFVTNCVKNNLCCLGGIISVWTGRDLSGQEGEKEFLVELNQYGLIVDEKIKWIIRQYPYVLIHNYVIMPNHFHLILEIDSAGTARELSLRGEEIKIKSLSSIMGALKTMTSKEIHKRGFEDFEWHRSFYDHIIRDEQSYLNISNYIDANPQRWFEDKYYNDLK